MGNLVPKNALGTMLQLLVDINWPSKTIWKPALNNATKDVFLFQKYILKTWKGVRNSCK